MTLRPPPPPVDLDPLILEIPAGTPLFRVHSAHRNSTDFNPGRGEPSRFAPLEAGYPRIVVPTMYAASSIAGALSESIFHDVPYRGTAKRILVSRLGGSVLSIVTPAASVRVAQIAGFGLRRIGVRRSDLIEGGPGTYLDTVLWASALHDCPALPDGLAWTSRQDDTARAYILFGDRFDAATMHELSAPIALDWGVGLDLVEQAATDAAITVIR